MSPLNVLFLCTHNSARSILADALLNDIWPGHPATAHWGYADPSNLGEAEEEKLAAFNQTMLMIRGRLERLTSLPKEKLEHTYLQQSARELSEL